ncbi:PREDICTED: uncharacterized protein LOC106118024 [Papilio xuthus]|uniref:Uncharacterized protein LOC106118024 n=1 Tax=Papilio xuthus TaxID=66420 RepID=A0AAJ6Z9T6_PAPXU|nr:PREDICTED: uncharacterized protein LOC106118024 [Papilio xuthus]
MDLSVEEFVDGLFKKEASEQSSDKEKPEDIRMDYPEWYSEKKYNQGRRFYWDNCFSLTSSMLLGLVAVFAVPSILRVLVSSRRSSSQYTAYRRYLSTLLHTVAWFENDLKPGSISWRSLYTVRCRHVRADIAAKMKGIGRVSQRDMALTQFGFIGFSILKPDKFSIRPMQSEDWESYIHFWRVIGNMIGLQDRYNICRKNLQETKQVCQLLLERVFTPSLDHVPEYFEHMARVMLEGMWSVNPTVNTSALLYWTRHLADVPGYVYTEKERADFQDRLREHLKDKSEDTGVDSTVFTSRPAIEGINERPPRLLYLHDYDTIESIPEYKILPFAAKYKLAVSSILYAFYSTYIGKLYLNLNFLFSLLLMKYFPYLAFFRFGIKASLVNIFVEDPVDNTEPKTNAEYNKPPPELPWYKATLSVLTW